MTEKKKDKTFPPGERVVLDSSALLTLWNDEPGSMTVEGILKSGAQVMISFMTVMECRYRLWKNGGRQESEEFDYLLAFLPVETVWMDLEIFDKAIEIKATYNLSICDSWIIATAIIKKAVLIHKDPEFEQVKNLVSLQTLPYKSRTSKR
jgi:predicted nucleic acid-binding protein